MYKVLFNPFADNGHGEVSAKTVVGFIGEKDVDFINSSQIKDYKEFFTTLNGDDKLVLCGGDGTLNYFVNACNDEIPENEIYLYPVGTGNDFLLDLGYKGMCAPVKVNEYIKDLPWVEAGGKRMFFIDNVAYGIDGWVCEIADQQKAADPSAKINYTTIAISGLLGKYKPCNAKVSVDGKCFEYERVWMAPAMNGRYFGGGMMVTPMQDRLNPDRTLTLMLYQNAGRLEIATGFPGIFSGAHVKNAKTIFHTGHEIIVEYDEPRAVQVDGETILGVMKYRAVKE